MASTKMRDGYLEAFKTSKTNKLSMVSKQKKAYIQASTGFAPPLPNFLPNMASEDHFLRHIVFHSPSLTTNNQISFITLRSSSTRQYYQANTKQGYPPVAKTLWKTRGE